MKFSIKIEVWEKDNNFHSAEKYFNSDYNNDYNKEVEKLVNEVKKNVKKTLD